MSSPEQYFRAGAGAVIINHNGLVLALERADVIGAWQFPQGGLDRSEEPFRAALREVMEETGIPEGDLELIDSYPEPLAYELPAEVRSDMLGRGQVQYWYLFRFNGNDEVIDVTSGGEFRAWQWVSFNAVLNLAADFRKSGYEKLADHFRRHISLL